MFGRSNRLPVFFALIIVVIGLAGLFVLAEDSSPGHPRKETQLTIVARPWGASQSDVDAAINRVESSSALRSMVGGAKYGRISFESIDREDKSGPSQPPTHFRVVFYDYTNDRTLVAVGDFAGTEPITVREEAFQPIASPEEFNEAVEILRADAVFSGLLKSGKLEPFEPMPDITVLPGTTRRLVNVGLASKAPDATDEIVSVSLGRRSVIRHATRAPDCSAAAPENCGLANSNQGSTSRGIAGQASVTVPDGQGGTLWEMLVIRPSASSGTRASGVEIRDVKYRGKSVLKRGHVPILNVQYIPQTCGPYRDWQYAEGFFNAPDAGSTNPAPGIRLLAAGQVATTVIESNNDTGNFQGVAIYQDHGETILVSEMNADWYRYIMEWRFGMDGSIKPRFGFGAVKNNCVCNVHHHHVFWRLDFDIVQPNNKVFRVERGRKFLVPLGTELKQLKNVATNRGLLIQNSNGNEAYSLVPNFFDGVADTFGVSDMWVLRYKTGTTPLQQELDDGFNQTTSQNAFIQIDNFLNNESIVDQDVVVWYGAHFIHDDGANIWNPDRSPEHISGGHVVGPDLRAVRW